MVFDLLSRVVEAQLNSIDRDELDEVMNRCSGFVKMRMGVANNCAIGIVRHAYNEIAGIGTDHITGKPRKPHPRFRHEVKQRFKQFFKEWRDYEMRLLYPAKGHTNFFCVADMPKETRKIYADMTDQQYFEFWQATGAQAYMKSESMVTSLQNKFRLSLEHHGVVCPHQAAWGMVGTSALEMTIEIWHSAMRSCRKEVPAILNDRFMYSQWEDFNVSKVAETWKSAVDMLEPRTDERMMDEMEMRNIALGLAQLRELMTSADFTYNSTIQAVKDFDRDIFRTRGQAKKAIRDLTELRDEIKIKG